MLCNLLDDVGSLDQEGGGGVGGETSLTEPRGRHRYYAKLFTKAS